MAIRLDFKEKLLTIISIYPTVSSAFGARWLACPEVIIQILLYSRPSIEQRTKLKISIIFPLIVTDKVIFRTIFSTCVIYTQTIMVVDIYLAVRQISNIFHLHLGK